MFTCILLIIMSCSTRGCVSPVRFMVPSNIMKAWTDGNNAWTGWSQGTDSIMGILRKKGRGKRQGQWWFSKQYIYTQKLSYNVANYMDLKHAIMAKNYPFTSDKHSSSLFLSAWFVIPSRPSVSFITACSTLFQAPMEESSRLVNAQQILSI